jgi:hypothetical protein
MIYINKRIVCECGCEDFYIEKRINTTMSLLRCKSCNKGLLYIHEFKHAHDKKIKMVYNK